MSTDVSRTVERLRRLTVEVVEPNAVRWDSEGVWPSEALRAIQQEGLAGLVIPSAMGGMGLGLFALVRACETLGRADASTALCFGMHCVGSACLAAKANDDHVRRFLRPICEGRHLTTLALSEPGTGSHFYLPQTQMAVANAGDSYRLNGSKAFVTNGGHADSYVLSTVATEPGVPPGHFSMVLVPAEADGLTWGPEWEGWGMRANSSRSVELCDVELPVSHRLGDEGDQIWYVFQVVAPFFLVAMAGTYLGVAQRAYDEAANHLSRRRYSHTGGLLSELAVLQHRLGTIWATLQRTRQLCYWAAQEANRDGPDALPALCIAKAEVGHTVVDIINDCMTLVGGQAYRDGSVLQRLLRDARAAHVMSPTTDILYTWAGRALLNLPLLGE